MPARTGASGGSVGTYRGGLKQRVGVYPGTAERTYSPFAQPSTNAGKIVRRRYQNAKPIPLGLVEKTNNRYGWEKRLHNRGWVFQKNANKTSGVYKPPPKRATPFTKPKELA